MHMDDSTRFMVFWKTVNDILKAHGQSELLYSEARGWWNDHQERTRDEIIKARCAAIADKAA